MKLPKIKKWESGFLGGIDIIDLIFIAYFFVAIIVQLYVGMYLQAANSSTFLLFMAVLLEVMKTRDGYVRLLDSLIRDYTNLIAENIELQKKVVLKKQSTRKPKVNP